MPTPSEHVDRLHRLFDGVWIGEDSSVAEAIVDRGYLIHDRAVAEELRGPDLYLALAERTRDVFPDMAFTIEDTIAQGDRVALQWAMTGTHEGSMTGEELTGREIEAVEINRFANGLQGT